MHNIGKCTEIFYITYYLFIDSIENRTDVLIKNEYEIY